MGGTAVTPGDGDGRHARGKGYWVVASDGGIFTFGDAGFHGSAAGRSKAQIIGIAITPDGGGYWLRRRPAASSLTGTRPSSGAWGGRD